MAEYSIPQLLEAVSMPEKLDWEEQLYAAGCEIARKGAEAFFEAMDADLYEMRPSGWRVMGFRERRLVTRFGKVRLRRRLYQDEEGRSHFLLDEHLRLPARQGATPSVQSAVVRLAGDLGFEKTAKHVAALTAGVLSKTTVWHLAQRMGRAALAQEAEEGEAVYGQGQRPVQEGTRGVERLFVEADGVFVRLQGDAQSHMEIKSAIAYEGWERLSGALERYRLIGKRVYVHGVSNLAFWEGASLAWSHHWDWSRIRQVIMGGDGASWIAAGCHWLADTIWQLDGFHLARAAGRACGKPHGQELYEAMRGGNFAAAATIWEQAPKRKRRSAKRHIRWLEKLLAAQQGQDWRSQLGLDSPSQRGLGTMEGNGAHLIADRMKDKGRSWSRRGARHMAKIQELIHNDQLETWCWRPADITTPRPARTRNPSRRRDTSTWLRAGVPALYGPHSQRPWAHRLRHQIHYHRLR